MSAELKRSIFPSLPVSFIRTEISDLTGISERTLAYWEKAGLLKPAREIHGLKRVFYNQRLLAKAVFIRILREEGFTLSEVRHEVCKPKFISQNLSMIQDSLSLLSKEDLE
jgi:DNA-binding transcriptional MerR regulator